MRVVVAAILTSFVAACMTVPSQDSSIVVIGDSVMAWNRSHGSDVGSVISAELDRTVVSRATFGAQIRASNLAGLFGLSIPGQLPPGRWEWVVANGGANDLGFSCRCTSCEDEIEALISSDGQTGEIPRLIERARSQNARVVWLGYYRAPETTSFQGCRPGLVEIERRIARFAASNDDVFFLDAETFFEPPLPELFDPDKTHPSAKGSALIGREIAKIISRNRDD